jgi:hypothetical protein
MRYITITRHLETKAYEFYSAVWMKDGHEFVLMARTTAELEILWMNTTANIPLNFDKIQHVCTVQFDSEKDVKQ